MAESEFNRTLYPKGMYDMKKYEQSYVYDVIGRSKHIYFFLFFLCVLPWFGVWLEVNKVVYLSSENLVQLIEILHLTIRLLEEKKIV
jgi:hypothetical protein